MELGDIIKWVDDTNMYLSMTYNLNAMGIEQHDGIREYKKDVGYISQHKEYAYACATEILHINKENKEALFRRLFRNSEVFFYECIDRRKKNSENNATQWIFTISQDGISDFGKTNIGIIATLEYDLLGFYTEVVLLCKECGLEPATYLDPEAKEVVEDIERYTRLTPLQNAEELKTYETTPRSHRIAAVKMLLDHTSVSKGIDKTAIAAFVEAVTGGNIQAKPKDTLSYKTPTKQAKEAAAEWLGKIGIEA